MIVRYHGIEYSDLLFILLSHADTDGTPRRLISFAVGIFGVTPGFAKQQLLTFVLSIISSD